MISLNPNEIFFIVLIASLGMLLLESMLAGTWNRFYFTFGIPVFIKRVPVNLFSFPPIDYDRLQLDYDRLVGDFGTDWQNKTLVFKELGAERIAFREKLLEKRSRQINTEVMHGLLILDQNAQAVVVIGYANWWLLGMTALALTLVLSLGNNGLLFVGGYLVVIGIIYFRQARRYSKLAQAVAAQVMEKK